MLKGLLLTLGIASIGLGFSVILGLGLALMRFSASPFYRLLARIHIGIFRNTPLLLQLFFIYFLVAPLFGLGPFWSAVISLAAFEGAYLAEIFRAGILAVPGQQWEAALSLGFNLSSTFFMVILPQSVRNVMPALTNQAVSLIKDTSLVSAIAVADLTLQAQAIIAETFLAFEVWLLVAAIYLLISLCISLPAIWFEHNAGKTPGMESQAANNASMIDKVVKNGVMRVGFSSFVPWAMQDKNGEYIGFEVDVAKRLAKDLGVDIELVPTRFSGIVPALLANKFDIIIGSLSVTPERNLKGNFTIPYDYATIEAVASKEKTKGLKFPDDYNKSDIIIAVRSGGTPAILARKMFPNATLRLFDDEAPAVQDVIAGRSHIMLSSAPLPAFETLKNPDVLYQPTKEALAKQPVGFLVRKGDPDSLNVLDNWIRLVEDEGWLKEKRDYWFKSRDWESLVR